MVFDRAKHSKCGECPFAEHKMVKGTGPEEPKIVVLGEAPGADEEKEGKPFVGASGGFLRALFGEAGYSFDQTWRTNVITKRPPKNVITSFEAEKAILSCRSGFLAELAHLSARGAKVIVPVGNTALSALGITEKIGQARGSIYMIRMFNGAIAPVQKPPYDFLVVPTYHPSYLIRGNQREAVTVVNDLSKAVSLLDGTYKPPTERFNLSPTLEEFNWFVDRCEGKLVAVDIEKTGGLSPYKGDIMMVGLALNGEEAMVVPFITKGGMRYWSGNEEKEVRGRLNTVLKGRTIYQNSLFDIRVLRAFGYDPAPPEHDTLLLSHSISPELKHNLGYIVSIYGRTPYWKDVVLKSDKAILAQADDVIRRYNARDCVVLHQVLKPMLADLKENGTGSTYEMELKLVWPVLEIMENGIKLSPTRLKKFREDLAKQLLEAERSLGKLANLPEGFSPSSDDHIRLLVYGYKANQFEKAREELKKYEENPKLNKNTRKYKGLVEKDTVATETEPIYLPKGPRKKTDSGVPATGKDALAELGATIARRIAYLAKFDRQTPDRVEERKRLERSRDIIRQVLAYRKVAKLYSTYTGFATGPDGRVHFPYKIHGTATGRFASGDRDDEAGNGQNIPKVVKQVFVAEKNWRLVEMDYSNLELRILAYLADDDVLIKTFEEGKNVHDENTRLLFDIDEDHPDWDVMRRASKTYIFGRNYGGGLKGIHQRVLMQVPESGLDFKKFKEIDAEYRRLHPKYDQWYTNTVRKIKIAKRVENAFGRVRVLLGTDHEILREGINFPIQSTAADLINYGLIDLQKTFREEDRLVKLVGSVHDSVLMEAYKSQVDDCVAIAKHVLERPVEMAGRTVSFPVDVKIGTNWSFS